MSHDQTQKKITPRKNFPKNDHFCNFHLFCPVKGHQNKEIDQLQKKYTRFSRFVIGS